MKTRPKWTFDLMVSYAIPLVLLTYALLCVDELSTKYVVAAVCACTVAILIRLKSMAEKHKEEE